MWKINKFLFTRLMPITFLCIIINACGSGSSGDSPDSDLLFLNRVVGTWERQIQRNSSTGISILEIRTEKTFQSLETGDYLIMNEWHSGLPDGVIYKFWSDPAQQIVAITGSKITLSSESGTAYIINNATKEEVRTWDISSQGGEYEYELKEQDSILVLKVGSEDFSYSKK